MAEVVRAQAQAMAVRLSRKGFKDSSVRLEGIHGGQSKRNERDSGNKCSCPSDLPVLPTVGQRGPKAKQYTSKSNTNETGYSMQTSGISIVLGSVGQLGM